MPNSKKVLLIGWDAADWKVIHKLMDGGKMPTLQRLVENGTMGNMTTLFPALSPMLWTSIATGKRPYKHGIYGFTEPTPDGLRVQPMTNLSRRSKAIWNILNQNDLQSIVVGWWPSHPAEPIDGVMVSDFYHKAPRRPSDPFKMMKNCVQPKSLEPIMDKMRLHPADLKAEHVLPFIPRAAEIDQDTDSRLSMLLRTISETVTLHRAGEVMLRTQPWDFAAIYYDAIDHFCHGFMKYHPPKQRHISQQDFDIYQNVVTQAYIYHDVMLGKLLSTAAEDTTVILMSDHGFHPDHLRPKRIPTDPTGPAIEHRDIGIFVACGKTIKKDHVVSGASLLDVAPTILSIYDLPYGSDMDGQPLLDIFVEQHQDNSIPSWEDVRGTDGQHPTNTEMDAVESKETLEQLIALGYIERPDDDNSVAVAACRRELDFNLARAYMDGDQYGNAIPLLANLYNEYPLEFRFGLQLANCLQSMGRIDELDQLVSDLNGRWRVARDAAKGKLREIAVIAKERRLQFRELKKIDDENDGTDADAPKLAQYDMRGKPMLFSPNESNAIRRLRAVARGNPQVLDFLSATIAAARGDFESAVEFMQTAGTSESQNPMFHFQLGNFHLGIQRHADAEAAYMRVLEIDRLHPGALMGLCRCSIYSGNVQRAIDFGRQAIGLRFHFPIAHFFLAKAHLLNSDFSSAENGFKRALEQNPNFVEAHRELEQIYQTKLANEKLVVHHQKLAAELQEDQGVYLDESEPIELKPFAPDEFEKLLPKFEKENNDRFLRCLGQTKGAPVATPTDSSGAKEIVIVTGLPRSGTSMMMQMLAAGGVETFIDEVRGADDSNPRGYYESAKVKKLAFQNHWLETCHGKAIKVVAPLVSYLPQQFNYRLILMSRDLDEIVRSQMTMLESLNRTGGNLDAEHFKQIFEQQLNSFHYLMKINNLPYCTIEYSQVINDPAAIAAAINDFLGSDLDEQEMSKVVDPSLYRQKS